LKAEWFPSFLRFTVLDISICFIIWARYPDSTYIQRASNIRDPCLPARGDLSTRNYTGRQNCSKSLSAHKAHKKTHPQFTELCPSRTQHSHRSQLPISNQQHTLYTITPLTMEQPHLGMHERKGDELGAYEGGRDLLNFPYPHMLHSLEFSNSPFLDTYPWSQSVISLSHSLEPNLDPFDPWAFPEIGNTARETPPGPSLEFATQGLWSPQTPVRYSQLSWQFGDNSRTSMSEEQATQQQPSQGGFQVSPPPGQGTSEWGSMLPNVKPTPGSGESFLSPTIATLNSSILSQTSHTKLPSCLPFPLRQRHRNLLQIPNSHTNRNKEGNDKSGKCPLCPKIISAVRDINRHLWSRHPQYAVQIGVKSETRDCPFRGCRYRGRRDNVNRHYKTKHGGCIKWTRGGVLVS
jgi:hypothetical protein